MVKNLQTPNILYLQMVEVPALVFRPWPSTIATMPPGAPVIPGPDWCAPPLLSGSPTSPEFPVECSYWLCSKRSVYQTSLKALKKLVPKGYHSIYPIGFINGIIGTIIGVARFHDIWRCTLDTASSIRCSRASTRALRCSASHLGGKAVMFLDLMLVIRNRIPPSLNIPCFKWWKNIWVDWTVVYDILRVKLFAYSDEKWWFSLSFIDFDGCFGGCNIANLPTCSIVMDAWRSGNNQIKLWLEWISALPTS